MSTDAELTFDDLIAFAGDPATQSPPATGPIATKNPLTGPTPIGPAAGRPAAGPVRASSHVNVELTRIERRRASLRAERAVTTPLVMRPETAPEQAPLAPLAPPVRELPDPFALPPKPASAPATAKPVKASKKGQFYRPELYSGWERFTSSLAVRIIGFGLLGAAVVGVVLLAVTRF